MKKYWFIICFLFSGGGSAAQINDSFSDGDFSTNPVWSGSTAQFTINGAHQLQLTATLAGSSCLSTGFSINAIHDFEWQVYVKQGFSPSGSNYGRIYLSSDEADLKKPLNGYYLQFGEAGSNDAIELFRQTGTVTTSVCRASNGAIASSFSIRVKVSRDPTGLWKLFADYSGGTTFTLESTGTDTTHTSSSYLGVLCVYTSSNAARFYYDDFYAGPARADTIAPTLQSIQVQSATEIQLVFSEALDASSAESISNYQVDQSVGHPLTASLLADLASVLLTFDQSFKNGFQYQLTITGIRDPFENTMSGSQVPFLFFVAMPIESKDVVITEILPDFIPTIGLPDAEYIEILNRSPNPVDLAGWTLSDGTTTTGFPPQVILPQQYWIVVDLSSTALFKSFGNVVGLPDFPTLNNDGDILILRTPEGITVDSVRYTIHGYGDPDKEEGGWSLELIDPNNPCGGEENWTASENPIGGTPGKQNSVFAEKPDLTGPRLIGIVPISAASVVLTFDETLDGLAASTGVFELTPAISISQANFTDRSLRQIQLMLASSLQSRQRYKIIVHDVRDCSGNSIQDEACQLDFALPEPADSLDLIVNELLFNPRPNGVDFIEVYNRSPKYLNLRGWKLASIDNNVLKDIQQIKPDDLILAPSAYLVLTADPVILKNNYPGGLMENFLQTDLPGLPDDMGSIVLANESGKVIDYFSYNKNFHSELIKDDEGVSLERISFSTPTNDRQNWKSASAESGFATPGYVNSNARSAAYIARGTVTLEPEIFIPGSGTNDFAKISYTFGQPGYIANIKVFDQEGHSIKTIANNENLGFEGFFRWDGDRDDGSKARMGYYVVWVEVFDMTGAVNIYRKRAVIATR